MASLSLPRVLQLKKNSLDAEREQFEKFQTLAIQKAINSIETPVKEKHVRSTIIGTFQEQSAITYWMVASRLPLQDNRIVAWKFCHVTHKLLREGHPACLDDSQRHVAMIDNLGKLWVHLREGYGRLVSLYCALLVTKLKFHARNPRFPGSMNLSSDELDNIAENDVNNYFQICVELFDYMDDILNLQAAVFDSLGNARANSMTASGQCRLAALIPCAQDSSHLYDCNVRLLFRLHAALPADTLAGHRDRFRQQFKKLSSFYKHASSLQYYRNLLSLPVLPSSPPNFLLQSDFGTYVAPVVSVPQPTDEPDTALIDTSDTSTVISSPEWEVSEASPSPSPQTDPVVERDRLIEHLQSELQRMRAELSAAARDSQDLRLAAQRGANAMDLLQRTQSELEEERQRAQALSAETPEIKDKLAKVEEKAKVSDEKFQKLKGAYTQLREEHIKLIRQKAEVDKVSASLRAAAAEHESAKVALQQQLNDRMKDVELLQQSASSSEEIEAYKNEIASLRSDLEQSRLKEVQLETLKASMESLQIEHQTAAAEAEEKLSIASNELAELKQNLEKVKEEKEEREQELVKVRTELTGLRETSGDEYKKAVEEKEAALQQAAAITEQFLREKQVYETKIATLENEHDILKKELTNKESRKEDTINKLNEEIHKLSSYYKQMSETKEKEIQILNSTMEERLISYNKQASDRDDLIKQAASSVEELKLQMTEIKQMKDNAIKNLEREAAEKEKQREMLEGRLNHVEAEKLNAESELQDLLQHNTELEDNLATLRKQLEDAQKELERNRAVIVSCAGSAALEVTQSAIKSLDHGNPQDNNMTSADLAAKAFEELAKNKEVKGNEEGVAAASFRAAHNTAQLSAYVTEVCNSSTDTELADKLTSECRAMLEKAQACLQSIMSGSIDPSLVDASRMIRGVSERSRAADGTTTSVKSVDDELNDMDAAIEQAAGQIEELLRASRAGDSGVKLEVNENILDACTTLMQAVKVLVQDARKLQHELGDPTTRANMYRRNPQWSEGLISAAKAVVFAAKLLVTSADEAVSSSARVEGVSAAAHEVAASSAQLVAASRARAPPAAPALQQLAAASRAVGQAVAALVAAVRHAHTLTNEHSALDTSALTLTATRRLEMDSKVRALELETALEAERSKLAALRKRHYMLAQTEENAGVTNGNSNS